MRASVSSSLARLVGGDARVERCHAKLAKLAKAVLLVVAASCAAGGVVRAENAAGHVGVDGAAPRVDREPGRAASARAAPSPVAMVEIAAGCFTLGPEEPVHVLVPREACLLAYRIDRTEVTVAAYRECVAAGACRLPTAPHRLCNAHRPSRGPHPMNCATYDDAVAYCAWRGARLPTPDEWERAARGPRSATYPWGEAAPTPALAVGPRSARELAHDVTTTPVCSSPRGRSAEGACDLAGNVAEWVAGYWADRGLWPTEEPAAGASLTGVRMTRGGSFDDGGEHLQAWQRQRFAATAPPNIRTGFRCAAEP